MDFDSPFGDSEHERGRRNRRRERNRGNRQVRFGAEIAPQDPFAATPLSQLSQPSFGGGSQSFSTSDPFADPSTDPFADSYTEHPSTSRSRANNPTGHFNKPSGNPFAKVGPSSSSRQKNWTAPQSGDPFAPELHQQSSFRADGFGVAPPHTNWSANAAASDPFTPSYSDPFTNADPSAPSTSPFVSRANSSRRDPRNRRPRQKTVDLNHYEMQDRPPTNTGPLQTSVLLVRNIQETVFDEHEIKNHFQRVANTQVMNVSLRTSFRHGHPSRTALVTFGSVEDATRAHEFGKYLGDIELNLSYYQPRPITMKGVERAAATASDDSQSELKTVPDELLLKSVPDGLSDEKALKRHMECGNSGAVKFVSIREKLSRAGAPRRTAIIKYANAQLASNGMKNASVFNGELLQLSLRKVVNFDNVMGVAAPNYHQAVPAQNINARKKKPKQQRGFGNSAENDSQAVPPNFQPSDYGDVEGSLPETVAAMFSAPRNFAPAGPRVVSPTTKVIVLHETAEKLREKIARMEAESNKKKRRDTALSKQLNNNIAKSRADMHAVPKKEKALKPVNSGRMKIDVAVNFVGTCPTMCPKEELIDRELQRDLSVFELLPGAGYRVDPKRAVKKYRRPAALSEQPSPSEVRPSMVLAMTMDYLKTVCDDISEPFHARYTFVRDRTRSIRQDFTFQGIRDDAYVQTLEECVRFHIMSEHRLCDADVEVFSSKQNLEQLIKCIITLREIYDERRERGEHTSHNEAEMQSYYILSEVIHSKSRLDRVKAYSELSNDVFNSEEMQFVHAISEMISSSFVNYVGFFQKVAAAPYLFACMLHKHFGKVRTHAVDVMSKVYSCAGSNGRTISVVELQEWLGFDSAEDVIIFCDHYEWPVSFDEADEHIEDLGVGIVTVCKVSGISAPKWEKGRRLVVSKSTGFQPSHIISGECNQFHEDAGIQKLELIESPAKDYLLNIEAKDDPISQLVPSPLKSGPSSTGLETAKKEKLAPLTILPSYSREPKKFSPRESTIDMFKPAQPSVEPVQSFLFSENTVPTSFQPVNAPVVPVIRDTRKKSGNTVLDSEAINVVKASLGPILNEKEIAEERRKKAEEEQVNAEKRKDFVALQKLRTLEDEFSKVTSVPGFNLDGVEKELKLLVKEQRTPQSVYTKLTELAMIVQSVSRHLSSLKAKARFVEPVFADTEEKKEWILLDCKDDIEFANELWNELWNRRKEVKLALLKRGGSIGTFIDRSKLDQTYTQNKKRGYCEDKPLHRLSKHDAALLSMTHSQFELRKKSMQKLLKYMKKKEILRFKVNLLKFDNNISNGRGFVYQFCRKMLASDGKDEQFPRFYYETTCPSYHEPIVVIQSSKPECDELNATNVLVIGVDSLTGPSYLQDARSAIQKATEKIRAGKYQAPFLFVVHNQTSSKKNGEIGEAIWSSKLQDDLTLHRFVDRGDIRGFKTVFVSHPKCGGLHDVVTTSMSNLFETFESVTTKEVDFMVYQELATSACRAGEVALRKANVVWVTVMANQRATLRAPFFETLDAINSAWKTLVVEIDREQVLWPSEHRVAQMRLRKVAARMRERLFLPYPSDLHAKSPGDYLTAFAANVLPGGLAKMYLGRVNNYPDFVASLARLMLPFVKKQMGDCFDTMLELPQSIARPSVDKKVIRHVLDMETNDDSELFPDPNATSSNTKIHRSRDDILAAEPPPKRSRPHDDQIYVSRELDFSPSRRHLDSAAMSSKNELGELVWTANRRASEGDLIDSRYKHELKQSRRSSLPLTHTPEDEKMLIDQLYELEQGHGRAIERAIEFVQSKMSFST